ncbi:MAG: LON peptidase substrate-binding domain-containing protein, partial [Gemmatimonadota bacterium]
MKADTNEQAPAGPSAPAAAATDPASQILELGILPLRNTVVYPQMPHQLTAGRDRSIRALEAAAEGDSVIGIFTQRNAAVEDPGLADLFEIGTVAKIHRVFKMPDGTVRLIVQGLTRARLAGAVLEQPYLKARVEPIAETGDEESMTVQALKRTASAQFQAIIDLSP